MPVADPARNLGHFFWFIDPDKFVGRTRYPELIVRYIDALHAAPARPAMPEIMAPGDREWRESARRREQGIPIDKETARFLGIIAA